MQVTLDQDSFEFRPWKPALGQVFAKPFAFDCETTLIDETHPWLVPAYVIGAAFDGKQGFFVQRADVAAFFQAHVRMPIVCHNAPFDLAVIRTLAPELDIYAWVDAQKAWDTQLLHRLYVLGTDGHTAGGKGESDLEHCAEAYLKLRLPKDVQDSKGNIVRLSYSQWLHRPPQEIEPAYLEYLAKDVITTRWLYSELRHLLLDLLESSKRTWGFVSWGWFDAQIRQWGPQTHHIQLRAAIVLKEIQANGLHLDVERRQELVTGLQQKLDQLRTQLRRHGYLAGGAGSNRSLQAIFRRLQAQHPDVVFLRTDTDLFATSHEALVDLADTVPFVRLLLEYRETEKLLSSFLNKMSRPVLHPSFNVLARSGRTSSFGEINAQNLPKDDRVRSCFVPSPGHVYIDADYATIELATLAQACLAQFQLDSQMAQALNAGQDLHALVAARVTRKAVADVSKEERRKAKPINFGKPGGMGNATLKSYARVSYGVHLDDEEVEALSEAWFDLFPEMRAFLADPVDTGKEVARLFQLTPAGHYKHTDDRRFLDHPDNADRPDRPHPILGGMCLKVLKEENPCTAAGKPYSDSDIDYFWSQVAQKAHRLPAKVQSAVPLRQPSISLQRAVYAYAGRASVFTLTGRLRARASYAARHNTIFQGLAADGAKLALWRLWRAGYRIVNFIHDQVLVEVPAGSALLRHAKIIQRLMIDGMQAVVPDVRVDVAYAATERWHKDAEAVFDRTGKKLLLWTPANPASSATASRSRTRPPRRRASSSGPA